MRPYGSFEHKSSKLQLEIPSISPSVAEFVRGREGSRRRCGVVGKDTRVGGGEALGIAQIESFSGGREAMRMKDLFRVRR